MLGYALQRDGTPTPTLAERVRSGVRLFDTAAATHLVFSGGHPGAHTLSYSGCTAAERSQGAWRCASGGGVRNRSEAAVMEELAASLTTTTKASERCI